MRIHTQLLAALAASIGLALVAALATVHAAQREDQASSIQARAQTTAHEVSGLLVLTQEYTRHSEPRAAQQWHQRHSAIAVALAGQDAATGAALAELRAVTQALPLLFARLEEIARTDDAFSLRRKEVLLDQLLVSTQAMSDNAYQWHQDAAQARGDAQTQFETIAFATPVAMLVVLALVAAIVRQRVLRPMRRLDDAAAAVGAGDLSVRIASDALGELGDLSRRFDAMTEALQRSGEQVRRSEKRLRAITDHIPALVGYFDADERCHFANDMALRVHGLQGTDVTRLTLRSGIGDENYALHEPHVRKVLQGQACAFEGHLVRRGRDVHYQAHLVPDRCDSGAVQGFYLMTFDVTALKTVERQLKALVELDALTGLPNRRQYDHRLPEAMRRADRNGRALALMFLDIDHFKSINDSLVMRRAMPCSRHLRSGSPAAFERPTRSRAWRATSSSSSSKA